MEYEVRRADPDEAENVVSFVDNNFTKEGYGFVTSAQIKTEIKRGSVFIAVTHEGQIVGVRVGIDKVYNLCVDTNIRRGGIGRSLIDVLPPETIRVKATPVGNLSKAQKDAFKSPRKFYEKLGYVFERLDFARNFWQRGKAGERANFHREGKKKHIEIYRAGPSVETRQKKLF